MTAALTPEVRRILNDRFGHDALIALATASENVPSVRTVDGYYEDGAFYVITHALSNKMLQIRENPAVAVSGDWFTARGTGVDLGYFGKAENRALAETLRTGFAAWIDNGHNDFSDENTHILCIRLTQGVLFAGGKRYEIDFPGADPEEESRLLRKGEQP